MTLIRLLIAYDGTSFAGYAAQPGLPTVQGALEDSIQRLTGAPAQTRAAGRTDAGVHATGQVVSFPVPEGFNGSPEAVARGMAALLPNEVSVLDSQPAPDGFDARYSARTRSYVYLIHNARARHPLLDRFLVPEPRPLDVDALDSALRALVGTFNFTSFARVRVDQEPVRTVLDAGAERDGDIVRIRITAQSFLHQMVRSIVGTALEVGLGRRPVEWIREVVEARDRAAAGKTMVARGLTLVDVTYDGVDWPNRPASVWPWASALMASWI